MSASTLQAIELPKSIPQRFPRAPRLRSLRTQRRRPRRKRRRSRSERRGPGDDAKAGGREPRSNTRSRRDAQSEAQRPEPRSNAKPSSDARDRASTGRRPYRKRALRRATLLTLRRGGQAPRLLPNHAASRGPRARPRAPRWAAPPGCYRHLQRPGPRTPRPVSGRRAPAPAGR